MSENNYGALMMKSAISSTTNIDEVLSPGIYPVLPGNTSAPDTSGGELIIYGGSERRTFTSDKIVTATSTYDFQASKWSDWNFPELKEFRWRDEIDVRGWGVIGNGIIDDTIGFSSFESEVSGHEVDLGGRSYVVSTIPKANRYFNGTWILPTGPSRTRWHGAQLTGAGLIVFGDDAASSLPVDYDVGDNRFTYTNGVIAMGPSALKNATAARQTIAIGFSALEKASKSFDNMALGEVALQNVSSNSAEYNPTDLTGTRNIGIGGNAGQFLTTGSQNVFIGRNSGTSAVNVIGATAVGSSALMGGGATGGWTPAIENWWPNTSRSVSALTAVGASAAFRYTGTDITALGANAGTNITRATNCTMVGTSAGLKLESNFLPNGHTQVIPPGGSYSATYSMMGNTITVTYPGHSAVAGQIVGFRIPDGPAVTDGSHNVYYPVASVIDANTFTVVRPIAGAGTGTFIVYTFDTGVAGNPCTRNTFVGTNAGHDAVQETTGNTFVGFAAGLIADNSVANTIVGGSAGTLSTKMTSTTLLGANAGSYGGNGATTLTQCTFVGAATGATNVDGSAINSYTNTTILGFIARASGDNQVQLGNSSTTTYCYGTVQNRSDARDKANVRDTVLGIDFIMGLRPVDGRWDMRDDYVEEYEVQVGIDGEARPVFETQVRKLPKDGSKKRERFHHWFIAQEVKELCDKLGVEFGGYQDHSVNGGCDVLSLGYDEFIPPTVRAVQQCWERMNTLEARLEKLEKRSPI